MENIFGLFLSYKYVFLDTADMISPDITHFQIPFVHNPFIPSKL